MNKRRIVNGHSYPHRYLLLRLRLRVWKVSSCRRHGDISKEGFETSAPEMPTYEEAEIEHHVQSTWI